MARKHNPPVTIQVYLGSGDDGLKLRANLEKKIPPKGSLSELVVGLMKKADPTIFKGVENGKK